MKKSLILGVLGILSANAVKASYPDFDPGRGDKDHGSCPGHCHRFHLSPEEEQKYRARLDKQNQQAEAAKAARKAAKKEAKAQKRAQKAAQRTQNAARPMAGIVTKTNTAIIKITETLKISGTILIQEQTIPFTLKPTGLSQNVIREADGKIIKVTTDNNAKASYQLESDRFPVKGGVKLKVPYDIIVEPNGIMSLGFLTTAREGWYGKELILNAGQHQGVYERTVPAGESVTSLVFRNYHLAGKTGNGGPGQTTFMIKKIGSTLMKIIPETVQEQKIPFKLKPTGLSQQVIQEADGKTIKVTTDNNANASYQLESDRFPVKEGETLKVPYDIIVEPSGMMSLGFLGANRDRWYGKELILNAGHYQGFYERKVPAGESVTSLVFRNYHLTGNGGPGQTTFRIKNIGSTL